MRILPRALWAVWLVGLAAWTYLLCVPTDWLPSLFRFHGDGRAAAFPWGKVGHACAYATLTAWVYLLGRKQWPLWAILAAHGVATEIVQSFVPTRTGKFTDVLIDWSGMAVGLALGGLGYGLRRKSRVIPPPQVQGDAGREDQNADVLR